MKQTTPNTHFRPHIFIDYYNHVRFFNFYNLLKEDAKRAKEELFLNDNYGQKRGELGDKSLEILFAIKKRCKDFNNPSGQNSSNQLMNG